MFDHLMRLRHRRAQGFDDVPPDASVGTWKCARCSLVCQGAPIRELGARRCCWHPLGRDSTTGHYLCCGYDPVNQISAQPWTLPRLFRLANGCKPADHVPPEFMSLVCKTEAGEALPFPRYLISTTNLVKAVVDDRENNSAYAAASEKWFVEHAKLVKQIKVNARTSSLFHATLAKGTLEPARKRAAALLRQRERDSKQRDEFTWVPYEPLAMPEPIRAPTEEVEVERITYLAQLFVAPPTLETHIGWNPATMSSSFDQAVAEVLGTYVDVPFVMVQVALAQ